MRRLVFTLAVFFSAAASLSAQQIDTVGIYGERQDTLNATVVTASGSSNFLSKGKEIRTEVITAAGLCKMACCNLAESFENSASVTVGYSDAVTGARQIRLLGQSGIYTQMLDENRPVMRGLSAPWGLTFVPSQWLESIQIAKGVTSVINGVESMTGQINMEHRKPTDEKPFYLQASVMDDSKCDVNAASSLQLDDEGKWSTVILAHGDANFAGMDHNADGFLDDPMSRNIALSNRWLYYDPSGLQVRFGVRGILDGRSGGQLDRDKWRADIRNKDINAYVKVGLPIGDDQARSVALVADYTFHNLESDYGMHDASKSFIPSSGREYDASQNSAFVNLLYQDNTDDRHHYTIGLSNTFDAYRENLSGLTAVNSVSRMNILGAFGEYTFRKDDVFTAIVGLRADWYNGEGLKMSPRLTLKYMPIEQIVLRANAGRGLRYSCPIIDNIGILSTTKHLGGVLDEHPLEDSWTFGANATWYLPFDKSGKTYLSLDYFYTSFAEQLIVDNSSTSISLYKLSDVEGGYSYTGNLQADFSTEPVRGLTFTLTGRFTDARQKRFDAMSDIKPMTSLYKAVFNVQYATNLNKWIFDFTASLNGPQKVWDFMSEMYSTGYTPIYPLLYAQVTKRFKGFDVYVGGENLTGFTQKNPIIMASDPGDSRFDASCVWGPLMGAKFYAGIRLTIWKTK
ncbi:MAG: TonB-dependent receptor [Bacteroidales bacterium]|nr:TonB-dependent receptor [Bacteroidales bacterium]